MLERYKYVDTRQYLRLPVSNLIKYKILEKQKAEKATLLTAKDRVKGGVSFTSNEKLPLSAAIELEISSPTTSYPIKAIAKIVRIEKIEEFKTYKIFAQLIAIKDEDMKNLGLIDSNEIINLTPPDFSINYKILGIREVEIYTTSITKDISGGGISFIAKEDLSASTVIELEINFPAASSPIKAIAKVVRSEVIKGRSDIYKVGAQFIKISEKDKKAIDDYVKFVLGNKPTRKWWWRKFK